MKKITAILLAVLMILPLICACNQNTDENAEVTYEKLMNTDWAKFIELGEYKGIELDMYPHTTDDEVEAKIDQLVASKAEEKEITDRAAAKGDFVDISYVGTMDGVAFSGGTADNQQLELGSGSYIEGFEDGLIGKKTGDKVTLNLNFPDPYKVNPDYSGKAVVFEVTINKVYTKVYPEVTDAFIAANSDYKTIDEYKTGNKHEMEKENHSNMVLYKTSYAYQEILNASKFSDEKPDGLYNKYHDEVIKAYEDYAKENNLDLDTFLKDNLQSTREDLESYAKDYADGFIKQTIILFRIAQLENLFIKTEDEYTKEAEAYATSQGYETVEELEEKISKDDIKIDITMQRAINFVAENVVETGKYSDGTVETAAE